MKGIDLSIPLHPHVHVAIQILYPINPNGGEALTVRNREKKQKQKTHKRRRPREHKNPESRHGRKCRRVSLAGAVSQPASLPAGGVKQT
jgi:hypothetical protein